VNKRTEGFLVGLLLAGSVAGVLFVFFVLREGPTGFASPEREPAAAEAPEKRERPRKKRPKTSSEEQEEPPPAPVEEEPEPPPPPPPPEDPTAEGRAELVLELLRPKEDEDRRVIVTVTDEQGLAVEGALVVVRMGRSIAFHDRTPREGAVAFDPYEDETGPFRIDALADHFAPGHAPEVMPGADVSIVLRLQPWVEGRVDAPSEGHGVVTMYTGRGRRTTAIKDDGTFYFEDVDPGWVSVVAEVDPYGADSERFYLRAGTRQYVRLKVRPRNRVKIFGEIMGWKRDGKAWMNNVPLGVNAKGRYEFERGVYGTNEILLDVPGKAPFQARFEVAGRKAQKHDFKLENDAEISGHVAAADTRQRLEGAEVRVGIDLDHPLNEGIGHFPIRFVPVVYTDEKGRFTVKRLKAGVLYTVSVVKHPYAQWLGNIPAKNFDENRILLPAEPYLFGRLKGLGGIPDGAKVTAYRLLEEPDGRQFNVERWDKATSGRDRKGFYGLGGLLPDVYVVRAEAPGYGAVETIVDLREPGRERMDLRIRKGDFESSTDTELLRRLPPVVETGEEFGAGSRADVTVLTIDVTRERHEIPLPGVIVRFFEGELEFTAPMAFDEDRFDLLRLPEATYRAVLSHPLLDKPVIRDGIRLRRGEPMTVSFRERSADR